MVAGAICGVTIVAMSIVAMILHGFGRQRGEWEGMCRYANRWQVLAYNKHGRVVARGPLNFGALVTHGRIESVMRLVDYPPVDFGLPDMVVERLVVQRCDNVVVRSLSIGAVPFDGSQSIFRTNDHAVDPHDVLFPSRLDDQRSVVFTLTPE